VPAITRILLIDDHSLFREAIARLLGGEPDFQVVGECATVEEGISLLREANADVVLLDINLGLQQGGAFLNLAWAQGFLGKVLVVTAGVSKVEAARLIERGCSGIILKHERPQLLVERIRALMKEPAVRPGTQPSDFGQFDPSGEASARPFTPRERQILRAVFSGKTNKEIAHSLQVSEPLVKAVLQQLFAKTGVRTRSQLVRTAIERHWKELEDETEGA
jgi:two-component system, NarL family, nitrate/nitrite response regulator NarL